MKKFLSLTALIMAFAFASFAQEMKMDEKNSPTDKDKTEAIPTGGVLKRGMPLSSSAKKVSLAKLLADPSKYAGQNALRTKNRKPCA